MKWEKTIEVLCIAGSSILGGALIGLPGFFASLGISLFGSGYVAKPVSKKIVKLRRSNYLVSVFDFKSSVDQWRVLNFRG